MDGSKINLTVPFRTSEIVKLQLFPDVTITHMCGSSLGYDINLYFFLSYHKNEGAHMDKRIIMSQGILRRFAFS